MSTAQFIKKLQPEADGLDFEGLRQEGIRLVQELCGETWTDYNLHDPGVTILEQVCYGLSDLIYRTGFPVADYLVSAAGEIDFERLSLHRPDAALACAAITENDYRKLIIDAVPNVENAWLELQGGEAGGIGGLYRVHLQLSERVKLQDHTGVEKTYAEAVRKLYAANRNLGEDLAEVRLAKRVRYGLRGEIDIVGNRAPASVLAKVYFECARYLCPIVAVRPYKDAYKAGVGLDALFNGVVTRSGQIAEEDLHPWSGQYFIQELSGRILRVEGVKHIRHLEFVDPEGNGTDAIALSGDDPLPIACFKLPTPEAGAGVALFRNDKPVPAPATDVEFEFNRLDYSAQAARSRRSRFDWVDALLPKGHYRQLGQYASIQHQFPEIYGVNAAGISPSAPVERKAAVAQLKAYLLCFDQIMANFLQNIQEIPALFTFDEVPTRSYAHQLLRGDSVPQAETVYRYDGREMETKLAEVVALFDDFGDRKNRILDYLLGLYGEEFAQNSLRPHLGDDADHEAALLRIKIDFLKAVVEIGQRRAAAFDYRKSAGAGTSGGINKAGLEKKLAVLLGLDEAESGFQLIEHVLLRQGQAEAGAAADFYGFRLSLLFPAEVGRYANPEFRKLVEETVALNCPVHLCPAVIWLDGARMGEGESLLAAWQTARRQGGVGEPATDAAAAALVRFLRSVQDASHG
ncbi:MAG TPA: hypothetical protein VI279_06455 [Rhodocyclaceae bacterium]